jgi:hypothetical protein
MVIIFILKKQYYIYQNGDLGIRTGSIHRDGGSTNYFSPKNEKISYSLRSILLFAKLDVSTAKIHLNTSILKKSNIGRREYYFYL